MNISFLSGMPRTGGTLLSSILSQNEKLQTSGNSPLCQMMWDAQISCDMTEPMRNYPGLKSKFISSIPSIVYDNTDKHVIDKCATWNLNGNMEIISKYITDNPKFIVTARPLLDIVKSFVFIRTMNGWRNPEEGLLEDNTDPLMRPLASFRNALSVRNHNFHFIKYDDLIDNPSQTINDLYSFMEWEAFEHSFSNIRNKNKEKDYLINLIGLHDIRPVLKRRKIDIELSSEIKEKIEYLDIYNQI